MSAKDRAAEDRYLAIRASEGDVEAFTKLLRAHSSLVYRVALRILGSKEDAQDASQEVWIKVWKNIKTFRAQSAFSTWLYRIAVNTCLSARQRESRLIIEEREYYRSGEEIPYVLLPEQQPAGGAEADPEAAALGAELRQELETALLEVRAEHRAALILRHMEGLSYAEIAQVLEVPEGTAKGWVSRGRAAMLIALAEQNSARRNTSNTSTSSTTSSSSTSNSSSSSRGEENE